MAGLLKAMLVLQSNFVPPNAGLTKLNPKIESVTEGFAVVFPTVDSIDGRLYEERSTMSMAGVSSFGYAGTISHSLLVRSDDPKLLKRKVIGRYAAEKGEVVLCVLTGHDSELQSMGHSFYQDDRFFHDTFDLLNAALLKCSNLSLLAALYPELVGLSGGKGNNDRESGLLEKAWVSQPSLVALQWGLVEMWRNRNVEPGVVLGHGIGEVSATSITGGYSMMDCMFLCTNRGRLIEDVSSNDGVTCAVSAGEEDILSAVKALALEDPSSVEGLSIDAVDGPASTTVSGSTACIEGLLREVGAASQMLTGSRVLYSHLAKRVEVQLQEVVELIDPGPCHVPLSSTVTGRLVPGGESVDGQHWCEQVGTPVKFLLGVDEAFGLEREAASCMVSHVLEIGPNPVLVRRKQGVLEGASDGGICWHALLVRDRDSVLSLMGEIDIGGTESSISTLLPKRQLFPWRELPHPLLQQ